ncbi:MAG: methyltransferase domain-containing protein [Polyangiaceae bacterium]
MFRPGGPTLRELVDQAMSETTAGYDKLAPKFDKTPFRTPDSVTRVMAERAAGRGVRAALDVCTGTGAALLALRPFVHERLVGLDLSAGMLEVARAALASAPGPAAVDLVQGDALDLPSAFDGAFDLVTCTGAFGHIETRDEHRLLVGLRRALAPGGRFVFVTSPMPSPTGAWFWMAHGFNAVMHARNALFSPKFVMYYLTFLWPEVRKRLEQAGFTVEAKHGLFPGPASRLVYVEATRRE